MLPLTVNIQPQLYHETAEHGLPAANYDGHGCKFHLQACMHNQWAIAIAAVSDPSQVPTHQPRLQKIHTLHLTPSHISTKTSPSHYGRMALLLRCQTRWPRLQYSPLHLVWLPLEQHNTTAALAVSGANSLATPDSGSVHWSRQIFCTVQQQHKSITVSSKSKNNIAGLVYHEHRSSLYPQVSTSNIKWVYM